MRPEGRRERQFPDVKSASRVWVEAAVGGHARSGGYGLPDAAWARTMGVPVYIPLLPWSGANPFDLGLGLGRVSSRSCTGPRPCLVAQTELYRRNSYRLEDYKCGRRAPSFLVRHFRPYQAIVG